jgi:hypothetical protein
MRKLLAEILDPKIPYELEPVEPLDLLRAPDRHVLRRPNRCRPSPRSFVRAQALGPADDSQRRGVSIAGRALKRRQGAAGGVTSQNGEAPKSRG